MHDYEKIIREAIQNGTVYRSNLYTFVSQKSLITSVTKIIHYSTHFNGTYEYFVVSGQKGLNLDSLQLMFIKLENLRVGRLMSMDFASAEALAEAIINVIQTS